MLNNCFKGKKGRSLSMDELLLWSNFVKNIKPQKNDQIVEKKIKLSEKNQLGSKKILPVTAKKFVSHTGADRKTFNKLRQGKMSIEKQIDLHGFTQDQAYDYLNRKLFKLYENGKRVILVITGKGKGTDSPDSWMVPEPGVLRRKVPIWLNSSPLKNIVLEIVPAKQKHGGEGAYYVLLRRKRTK